MNEINGLDGVITLINSKSYRKITELAEILEIDSDTVPMAIIDLSAELDAGNIRFANDKAMTAFYTLAAYALNEITFD